MKYLLIILLLLTSGALGFLLSYYLKKSTEHSDIPIIQTFHSPISFVENLKGDPQAGRKIFKEFCASCHDKDPIIDLKAPLMGDKKIWIQLNKINNSILLKRTIEGHGAMPARGGCFECSDAQLNEALQYMLKTGLKPT